MQAEKMLFLIPRMDPGLNMHIAPAYFIFIFAVNVLGVLHRK
jgi:hypothetical protein